MKFAYPCGARPLEGYTIKRGIGVGGFGEVYFATSDAGKEVALKRVQRHLEVEVRGVTQCLNLKHVNLIGLFDIRYNDEGEAWVVMEYVNGESLKDVLDRHPQGLPPQEVDQWFQGLAAGVVHLHDHGIVHRDLKPGNMFLDDGVVKIGDYGLSKFISCSRRSGQTESVGTFHYMAPEIGKGVYGKEIDIYALGVILYEMLTGRVPFDGESSQEIIMKHLTADPDLSAVSEPYREVIRRALLKDPSKRISSVPEMMAALRRDGAEHARPAATAAEQCAPPIRRQTASLSRQDSEGIQFGPLKEVVPAEPAEPAPVPASEEPIAQAVGAGGKQLVAWWRNANFSTPVKMLILLGVLFVMGASSGIWIHLAVLYLMYLAIRGLILAFRGPTAHAPSTPPSQPQNVAKTTPPTRCVRNRRVWKEAARAELRRKPRVQQLAELTGSMLMSAAVAAVLCLLMMVLSGDRVDGNVQTWSHYAWLTLVSVGGAWSVLTMSKCWEGDEGDRALRRFVMLVFGIVLGAAACGIGELLMLDRLSGADSLGLFPRHDMPRSMFLPDGTPLMPGYLVYFAGLFLILCWWRQADPLRTARLSLWQTAKAAAWGFILPFPQPCGVMLAATMSVAVQLSATWMNPRERAGLGQHEQTT